MKEHFKQNILLALNSCMQLRPESEILSYRILNAIYYSATWTGVSLLFSYSSSAFSWFFFQGLAPRLVWSKLVVVDLLSSYGCGNQQEN
jgi:hypothetical protein